MNDEERPLTPDEIARYENIAPGLGLRMVGLLEDEGRRQHERMMDGSRTVRLGLVVFGFVALGLLFAVWSIKHEVARTVIFMIVGTSILTPLTETISDRFGRFRTNRQQRRDR